MWIRIIFFAGTMLVGCATERNYEGPERSPEQLATLLMREGGKLALLSVDGIQFHASLDPGLSDKRAILAGQRQLEFSYQTLVVQGIATTKVYYNKYKGRCVLRAKHTYLAAMRGSKLQIIDVGEVDIPKQPLLIGGPAYVMQLDEIEAKGTPAECEVVR